jgi:hypothetical protein
MDRCPKLELWVLGLWYVCVLSPAMNLAVYTTFVGNHRVLQYCRTATSDAVVYFGGPAIAKGIFATISVPSSLRNKSALLNPPSIFSISQTGECCPPRAAAIAQSRSRSKLIYLRLRALFSLARKCPPEYLNNSSRLIVSPIKREFLYTVCSARPGPNTSTCDRERA